MKIIPTVAIVLPPSKPAFPSPLSLFNAFYSVSCAVFTLLKTELHVSLRSIANPLLLGRFWKLRRIPLEQCHCLVFQQMCLFGCPNLLSNHSWMSRPGVSFDNPKKKKKKVCKWVEMSLVLSPCKNLCDMGNYKWVTMLFVIEERVCLYIYF